MICPHCTKHIEDRAIVSAAASINSKKATNAGGKRPGAGRPPREPSVYRFSTLAAAVSFQQGTAKVGYAVLLGCDGLFWVPVSNRETGRLLSLGYEIANVT